MKSLAATAVAVTLASGLLAGPVLGQSDSSDQIETMDVSRLAVVSARAGSFAPDSQGSGPLVLEGVDHVIWFTDRPAREVGVYSVESMVHDFFDNQEPPNAALELLHANADADVVIVELADPRYDSASSTLTLDAQVIQPTSVEVETSALSLIADRADPGVPTTFGASALFIDSASGCRAGYWYTITKLSGVTCADAGAIIGIGSLDPGSCPGFPASPTRPWVETTYGQWRCEAITVPLSPREVNYESKDRRRFTVTGG